MRHINPSRAILYDEYNNYKSRTITFFSSDSCLTVPISFILLGFFFFFAKLFCAYPNNFPLTLSIEHTVIWLAKENETYRNRNELFRFIVMESVIHQKLQLYNCGDSRERKRRYQMCASVEPGQEQKMSALTFESLTSHFIMSAGGSGEKENRSTVNDRQIQCISSMNECTQSHVQCQCTTQSSSALKTIQSI